MHRSFYALAAFVALAGAAAVIPACSDEGEGERCDVKGENFGTGECQTGLVCKLGTSLPSHPNSDVCCPLDPAQATTVICSAASGFDSGPAPDTGDLTPTDAGDASTPDTGADASPDATPDTSVVDSAIDSQADGSPDASIDSSTDANLDAPADG